MSSSQKGFSLIELLIAITISSFLVLLTMSMNLSLFQRQMFNVTRSNLSQDALAEVTYLGNQIQNAGVVP